MFDKETLAQLRGVVREEVKDTIREETPHIVQDQIRTTLRDEVPPIVREEMNYALEHVIMPQFDRIYAELETKASKEDVLGLKNQGSTKGWVEDRLDRFRIDHGLKYKPAR